MRRRDREMDREFGLEIIDRSKYGILSMVDENKEPYGIPLSIVREGNFLYFHSAREGRKVDIFKKNTNVSLAFVGGVEVPENYTKSELEEITKDMSKVSLLISNVFTTEFESVIVKGKVKLIEDEKERTRAMKLICQKYTPTKMEHVDMALKAGLSKANVYKIEMENISAKRKKYDKDGKEIKSGKLS